MDIGLLFILQLYYRNIEHRTGEFEKLRTFRQAVGLSDIERTKTEALLKTKILTVKSLVGNEDWQRIFNDFNMKKVTKNF
jgi:hypothetical protein